MQSNPSFAESLRFQVTIKHMDASLFSEEIQIAPVPKRFIVPCFKMYMGPMDHVAHIQYYCKVITLYQQDNALLYKVLLAILNEGYVAWFQQLPPCSVTSFAGLSTHFLKAYALQIKEPKRINNLFKVVKYLQESLKQFVDRFEMILKFVSNPGQFMAYTALTNGLMQKKGGGGDAQS